MVGDRSSPLDVILAHEPPVDPIGNPNGTRKVFDSYVEAGATGLSLRFRHDSLSHYIEQTEAAAGIARQVEVPER
jgi:hypothetical protein